MRAPERPRGIKTCSFLHTYTIWLPRCPSHVTDTPNNPRVHESTQTHENTVIYTHPTIIQLISSRACPHEHTRVQLQEYTMYVRRGKTHVTFSNVPSYAFLQHTPPARPPATGALPLHVWPCTAGCLPALPSSFGDFKLPEGRDPVSLHMPHSAPPRASSSSVRSLIQNILVCTSAHLDAEHTNVKEL